MNHLLTLLVWSWAQTGVVAGIAIGLSAWALRRSPVASATAGGTGVAVILVLTVLSPAPVPRWDFGRIQGSDATRAETSGVTSIDRTFTHSTLPRRTASPPWLAATWSWKKFHGIVASLRQTQSAISISAPVAPFLLTAIGLGLLFGMARVALGVRALAVLRRESRVVSDRQLAERIGGLSTKLGIRRVPSVRESSALQSAAVVGWRCPTIMLPGNWRAWSSSELRAVLAHELAHVVSHDTLWRLVTSLAVVVQCAQPLVYWLRHRFVMAQEIAADQLAAWAIGSRDGYLRALSQLALRQDSRPMVGPAAALLPVFSGFLLWRIEMLRAQDGSPCRGLRLTLQASAIAVLMAVAASTTTLRGWAQQPDARSAESIRIASARDAKEKTADPQEVAGTLFRRPVFDLATAGVYDSEGFILRVGEILGRPELADWSRELDGQFATGRKEIFPVGVPSWSLKDIEFVAGKFQFIIKPLPQPTSSGSNQIMFGTQWVMVHWRMSINESFESLLRLAATTDETLLARRARGRIVYLELPVIPVIGPQKMYLGQLDEYTLMISTDEATLIERMEHPSRKSSPAKWREAWSTAEGGLFTAIATDKEFVRPFGDPVDADAQAFAAVFRARRYAIGADLQPGKTGVGVLKIQFQFDDEVQSRECQTALQAAFSEAAQESNASETLATEDQATMMTQPLLRFLKNARITTRPVDGAWQVDVQLAAPFDLSAFVSAATR